jgi:hypothetical protein
MSIRKAAIQLMEPKIIQTISDAYVAKANGDERLALECLVVNAIGIIDSLCICLEQAERAVSRGFVRGAMPKESEAWSGARMLLPPQK